MPIRKWARKLKWFLKKGGIAMSEKDKERQRRLRWTYFTIFTNCMRQGCNFSRARELALSGIGIYVRPLVPIVRKEVRDGKARIF